MSVAMTALAVVAAPLAAVLGALLHEGTHYVLAAIAFVEARLIRPEKWRLAVEYDMVPTTWNYRLSYVVNLAPGIIGIGAWLAAIALGVAPGLSLDTAWLYAGSVFYIVGGTGDYLF